MKIMNDFQYTEIYTKHNNNRQVNRNSKCINIPIQAFVWYLVECVAKNNFVRKLSQLMKL